MNFGEAVLSYLHSAMKYAGFVVGEVSHTGLEFSRLSELSSIVELDVFVFGDIVELMQWI